jgi:hypothetical protein
VDGVVFLGGVFACEFEDDARATGVRGQEVGDVVDMIVENYPAAVLGIVLCN